MRDRESNLIWGFGDSLARDGSAGDHAVNDFNHVTACDGVGNESPASNYVAEEDYLMDDGRVPARIWPSDEAED